MNTKNILHINSSGRHEGSVTRQVSDLVVNTLKENNATFESMSRDVAVGLPFVNEAWINANFTDADARTEAQKETLSLSDKLVAELQKADHIVIGSPIYNFSIPAALKAWVDMLFAIPKMAQWVYLKIRRPPSFLLLAVCPLAVIWIWHHRI